jgi:dipeptidase E
MVPAGYPEEIIWEGLALINYCLAPHFRSNHPESELIEQTINYFLNNKILFKALRDGEVIIIE